MAKTPKAPATRKRKAPAPKAPKVAVEAEPVAEVRRTRHPGSAVPANV